MKIRLDIAPEYQEKEIVIRAAQNDAEVTQLIAGLKDIESRFNQINGYIGETLYSLALSDILFFETNDRNVFAHTTDNAFLIHYRLYELEENLPDNFLRISKSSILNINEVSSLSRSVTGNLIQFRNSYKQIYVSRRFLKELKMKLSQRSLKNEK